MPGMWKSVLQPSGLEKLPTGARRLKHKTQKVVTLEIEQTATMYLRYNISRTHPCTCTVQGTIYHIL